MYSLYISSDALTFDGTGLPQGTTMSSLHFTYSDSRGIFLPSPFVECFPSGGLSIYWMKIGRLWEGWKSLEK